MTSVRRTALVAGVLYLITFLAGIPSAFLLEPVLSNPNYIVGDAADTQVLFGNLLDVINALACIGTAVALYPLIRRHHEGFALGFVTIRMAEAAVILIGTVSLLAVVTLRQEGPAGADTASLVVVGRALVAVRDWTFLLGPSLMPAFSAMLLGYVMYRSGLVPRLIPTMGLIGAPLVAAFAAGLLFGVTERGSAWEAVAVAPIFFWELSLGLWMTFKGFKPDAPLALRASAPQQSVPATRAGAA